MNERALTNISRSNAKRFKRRYWTIWQHGILVCGATMKLTKQQARKKLEDGARNGVRMEAICGRNHMAPVVRGVGSFGFSGIVEFTP